jgi:hypothetical protein
MVSWDLGEGNTNESVAEDTMFLEDGHRGGEVH